MARYKNYEITDISQAIKSDVIMIYFTMCDTKFAFYLGKDEKGKFYYPHVILHLEYNHEIGIFSKTKKCGYCLDSRILTYCTSLNREKDYLFETLIKSKELRLLWLSIPYRIN
jgi:hypothetical protein